MSMNLVVCALLLFCLASAEASNSRDDPGPTVSTSSGNVEGLYTDLAKVFRSIPYALPPVGDLRWKDPVRAVPAPHTILAKDDPPGCPQAVPCDLPIPQYVCPKKVSEDCLFLNVFTPRTATESSKLHVMVFLHGGNFIRGYSGGLLYDAQYMANSSDVVVVTVNYRLGAVGFLVYGEGEEAVRGNFGLRDQRMALEWVQENIANFGGNPDEVTLWGQSAGAVSVAVHAASVKSSGLFNKAIIESNPFGLTLKSVEKAKKLGRDFARELSCNSLECMMKKNVTALADAAEACLSKIVDLKHIMEVFLQWTPVVDYIDLSGQPIDLLSRGVVDPIPMMVGTTSEEAVFFIYQAFTSPVKSVEADATLKALFPSHYQALHKLYNVSSVRGDHRPTMSIMGTDFSFTCTTRYAVWGVFNYTAKQIIQPPPPIYLYVFNHSISFDPWGKEFDYCNGHSCHAIELPFVFHTLSLGEFTPTSAEMELATNMTQYWTNFAKTGNPNGAQGGGVRDHTPRETWGQGLPEWPQFSAGGLGGTSGSSCMRFKTPQSEVITNYRGDICSLWDSIGYDV